MVPDISVENMVCIKQWDLSFHSSGPFLLVLYSHGMTPKLKTSLLRKEEKKQLKDVIA